MASNEDSRAYPLHDRRQRLDKAHEVLTHAIHNGNLLYQGVPSSDIKDAVAHVGCGTGIWLNEVARTYFSNTRTSPTTPLLVGFNPYDDVFPPNNEPHVKLVKHNCIQPFDAQYWGKFDLVHVRGLAYAVTEERLVDLMKNAIQLIKQGGYLQWFESETSSWKSHPSSYEMDRVSAIVSAERLHRKLVQDIPLFMCKTLEDYEFPSFKSDIGLSIRNFELLPGGVTQGASNLDAQWIDSLSKLLFESAKLLLDATAKRVKDEEAAKEANKYEQEVAKEFEFLIDVEKATTEKQGPAIILEIECLKNYIDKVSQSGEVVMGGEFPCLVAQKGHRFG
ncbi:MAG: hypothetical protein M1820_002211 [Bogoriella megaspora]|nr:MAG: hypothetical protein M1820_002211 [Bogoriella megaspora]